MALWYFLLLLESEGQLYWNYWLNRHDCHSDYRSNRKYHRVTNSYSPINGGKYCRNNL
jgi:hypothetical protein